MIHEFKNKITNCRRDYDSDKRLRVMSSTDSAINVHMELRSPIR